MLMMGLQSFLILYHLRYQAYYDISFSLLVAPGVQSWKNATEFVRQKQQAIVILLGYKSNHPTLQ